MVMAKLTVAIFESESPGVREDEAGCVICIARLHLSADHDEDFAGRRQQRRPALPHRLLVAVVVRDEGGEVCRHDDRCHDSLEHVLPRCRLLRQPQYPPHISVHFYNICT
jgi:hypothetical protein